MIKHVIPAFFISVALAASTISAQAENVDREAADEQIQQRVLETKERLQITEEQAPVVQEILKVIDLHQRWRFETLRLDH